MVTFASREWVDALDRAVRDVAADGPGLRVRYVFTGPEGDAVASYELAFGDGVRARCTTGLTEAAEPDVTITQPLAVAAAVGVGTASAQQALLDGSIAVRGRVVDLVRWRRALDGVDAATVALRASTQWP